MAMSILGDKHIEKQLEEVEEHEHDDTYLMPQFVVEEEKLKNEVLKHWLKEVGLLLEEFERLGEEENLGEVGGGVDKFGGDGVVATGGGVAGGNGGGAASVGTGDDGGGEAGRDERGAKVGVHGGGADAYGDGGRDRGGDGGGVDCSGDGRGKTGTTGGEREMLEVGLKQLED